MSNLLFDLDGTLVDSSEGIIDTFQSTFERLSIPCPSDTILSTYIGPPLETTFSNYFNNQKDIDLAISYFRTFYKDKGVHQVTLYNDVKKLLTSLQSKNFDLFVTTSKFEPMAKQMLKELEVDQYFKAIYGSQENRFLKTDVINACLIGQNIDNHQAIIIGDTKFDMIGGKNANINRLGVTWGFGTEEELLSNGAEIIAHQPLEILTLI